MFLDPNATFSPGAAQDLLSKNFLVNSMNPYSYSSQAQDLSTAAVPEPSTYLLWTVIAGGIVAYRRRRVCVTG